MRTWSKARLKKNIRDLWMEKEVGFRCFSSMRSTSQQFWKFFRIATIMGAVLNSWCFGRIASAGMASNSGVRKDKLAADSRMVTGL
jgi:hypothetical protein